jgi:hypothetical protein
MNIHDLQRIRVELSKQIEPPLVPALTVDEQFIIPTPEKGEQQSDYINRCMDKIGGEYDTPEQAVAVCHSTWDSSKK